MKFLPALFFLMFLAASTMAGSVPVHSRSGAFVATVEFAGSAKRWPESNQWKATIRSADGSFLYSVTHEVQFDVPFPAILLSDEDGSAAVLNAFEGWVDWHTPAGTRLSRWRPFGGGPPDYERAITAWAASGRAAVLLSETGRDVPARLVILRMDGTVEEEMVLEEHHAGSVFLSDDGNVVVAGTYSSDHIVPVLRTTVIELRTGRRHTHPFLMRHADVHAADGRVLITDGRDVYEGPFESPGKVETGGGPASAVTHARYAGDGFVLVREEIRAGTDGIRYANPRMTMYGRDGHIVDSAGTLRVSLRPSILIVGRDSVGATYGKDTVLQLPLP